jgi:hypothetical protein
MTASPRMNFRLTYVSSASRSFAPAELEAILATARVNNAAEGVTGLLLFHDGNFLQTLEGEEHAVRRIYARIERDPRHVGCIVLERRAVHSRLFDDWAMACRTTPELRLSQKNAFSEIASIAEQRAQPAFEPQDATDHLIDSFLASFRDI